MEPGTAHVCGTSIGCIMCIELGAIAPQRLRSLVIAEAAIRSRQEWAAHRGDVCHSSLVEGAGRASLSRFARRAPGALDLVWVNALIRHFDSRVPTSNEAP